jgi:RNA polymerase sigma-70 factor (ECF subfamily)
MNDDVSARLHELVARSGVAPADHDAFRAWLGARLDAQDGAALDALAARDLGVAWGCCRGDAGALATFERDVLPAARAALAQMRADDATIDEQLQVLRTHVLVGGDGAEPRLAEYRGTGGLRRWVRAVAVRQYLNSLRGRGRELPVAEESVLDALAEHGDADPELKLLKGRFREAFGAAFAEAARGLRPLERGVLRYTFVDGLGLDALGKALRVSRATAHRRLADARAALLAATERALQARLGVMPEEMQSLYRLVRSQMEISLRGALASELGPSGSGPG